MRHKKSVVRQAAPCLGHVVKKQGFARKRCGSATFQPPILRPGGHLLSLEEFYTSLILEGNKREIPRTTYCKCKVSHLATEQGDSADFRSRRPIIQKRKQPNKQCYLLYQCVLVRVSRHHATPFFLIEWSKGVRVKGIIVAANQKQETKTGYLAQYVPTVRVSGMSMCCVHGEQGKSIDKQKMRVHHPFNGNSVKAKHFFE